MLVAARIDVAAVRQLASAAGIRPAEDELERAVLDERFHPQPRVGTDVGGTEAALQRDLAVVHHADVERDGARVDAGDSRQTSSLATS